MKCSWQGLGGAFLLLLVTAAAALAAVPGEGHDPVRLEKIRSGRHPGYLSVVFECSGPFDYLTLPATEDALVYRLSGAVTDLPASRTLRDLGSWVTLTPAEGDLEVKVGLPPDVQRVETFRMKNPSRLVVNLYPAGLQAAPGPPLPVEPVARPTAPLESPPPASPGPVTLTFRDVPIAEVFEMLSRKGRVNIVLGKEVSGTINANLYQVGLEEAILAVADSAGYAVARRHGGYVVLPKEQIAKGGGGLVDTELRTFKLQYADPAKVEPVLAKHLSSYGKITFLAERNLLVVEDLPAFASRIERLMAEIDRLPRQIQIEARILEITLDQSETFGLDWQKLFSADGGNGTFGLQGFAFPDATGFVAKLPNADNVTFVLNLLNQKGRVHTLSTPKLIALENQQASVIIGDRQGYRVTTTINQVSTESIEFLESGVILMVTPQIDEDGNILLHIHPEVSTGTIRSDGVPSQTTTEVDTNLLTVDGETVFIGGLIKSRSSFGRKGVPVLGSIPLVGRLFSSTEELAINTETIILITPSILDESNRTTIGGREIGRVRQVEEDLPLEKTPAEWQLRGQAGGSD